MVAGNVFGENIKRKKKKRIEAEGRYLLILNDFFVCLFRTSFRLNHLSAPKHQKVKGWEVDWKIRHQIDMEMNRNSVLSLHITCRKFISISYFFFTFSLHVYQTIYIYIYIERERSYVPISFVPPFCLWCYG